MGDMIIVWAERRRGRIKRSLYDRKGHRGMGSGEREGDKKQRKRDRGGGGGNRRGKKKQRARQKEYITCA